MTRLLLRLFSWRHCRLAPGSTLLLVLILAVGVAAYFSVRLANRAAAAGFAQFTGLLNTQSDWVITPPAGRLPETVLREIRTALGTLPVHVIPVVETTGAPPQAPGAASAEIGSRITYTITGVDLVAVQNLPTTRLGDSAEANVNFWRDFSRPNAIYIPAALARREGLQQGSAFTLTVNDTRVDFHVAGVLPENREGPQAPDTLILMDLPRLQAISGRSGKLDRIEFIVEDGPLAEAHRKEIRRVLESASKGRWNTASPNERRESADTMTRAFRMNLTILSLLALLVGLYLIFQALDGAVVRRREEIGILRSLGVTAGSIRRAWLMEAALLGLAGGILGALLGWGAAQWTVRAVGRTVNALYYASSAETAHLHAGEFAAAVGLGVGAALLAGWRPARQAALSPPAQILRRSSIAGTVAAKGLPLAGVLLLAASAAVTLLPPLRFADGGRIALGGYLAALFALTGGSLLTAPALRAAGRLLGRYSRQSAPSAVAASHLRAASSRHRTAAAGLFCATAMTAGMAIMISSFDTTMRRWIDLSFMADLYISSDGAQSASSQNRIPPESWRAILAHPQAGEANVVNSMPVEVDGKRTLLASWDFAFAKRHRSFHWLQAPMEDIVYDATQNAAVCFVSEAFSERFQRTAGDRVILPTPAGPQTLTIAGVFADYGNDRGTVMIDRAHFAGWFGEDMAASVILFVKPGSDPAAVRADLLTKHPGLTVFTNAALRQEILRIFQQTFVITWALEFIGLAVAIAGLGLSLASMLVERRAELATLRSLGMTQREISCCSALEGAGIALGGVLPGIGMSLALGWILIRVINKQTFGWTLIFDVPWLQITAFAVLILTSAALTGWFTGRRSAKLPADREE